MKIVILQLIFGLAQEREVVKTALFISDQVFVKQDRTYGACSFESIPQLLPFSHRHKGFTFRYSKFRIGKTWEKLGAPLSCSWDNDANPPGRMSALKNDLLRPSYRSKYVPKTKNTRTMTPTPASFFDTSLERAMDLFYWCDILTLLSGCQRWDLSEQVAYNTSSKKFQHLFADYVLTQCTVSEKACHYLKELKRSMVFHCCSSGSKLDKVVCWGDLLLIAVLRLLLGHMRSSCHTEQVSQFSLFWKRSWIAFFSTPPW